MVRHNDGAGIKNLDRVRGTDARNFPRAGSVTLGRARRAPSHVAPDVFTRRISIRYRRDLGQPNERSWDDVPRGRESSQSRRSSPPFSLSLSLSLDSRPENEKITSGTRARGRVERARAKLRRRQEETRRLEASRRRRMRQRRSSCGYPVNHDKVP